MNDFVCKWLSPIITLEQYNNNWEDYNSELYNIFLNDFIKNKIYYKGKKVEVRINPKQNNYEHAFIHLTCISTKATSDPNDRLPDLRRCERIKWNREIIENSNCKDNCVGCKKVLYYEQYYKNNVRINLVFIDAKFKVILEKRDRYYLLITGYYIEFNHTIRKELEKVAKFNQQKTPLD